MKAKYFFLFFLIALLITFGCKKAECESSADCVKPHFAGTCINGICAYDPIPNECGNLKCESGETKCSCPEDCGICAGTSGPFELICLQDKCVEVIPASMIEPALSTQELSAGGDKLRVTTTFNQPFNLRMDLFNVKISLTSASPNNADRKISKLTLIGTTKDKQVVPLSELDLNRPLWPGSEVDAELILALPFSMASGTLTSIELQVTYDYLTGTTTKIPKSIVLRNKYPRITFDWVMPSTPYPCPESCDDNNPGTADVCDASTNFFCKHIPVPGACGNYICEANENPCTCPSDCGPCLGDTTYTFYGCSMNKCIAQLKPGISQAQQSLFDDMKMSKFHLQNNYEFLNPLDVSKDKLKLSFSLYNKQPGVSDFKIETIRLFEGINEIAAATPNLALPEIDSTGNVELSVPLQSMPEMTKTLALKIWYEYKEGDATKKASYTKSLGKVTLLSPGLEK